MAKFCTKCGSPLEEGQKCKCETVEQTKVVKKNNARIGDLMKEFLEIVKKTFTKPIDVLKENASEDKFNLSLVAIATFGIVLAIFTCLLLDKTLGNFSSLIEIPYVKIFLECFIIGAGTLALMALIGYVVIDKLFKGETSIKKLFVLFGLTSIISSVSILVAILATILELNINIICVVVALGSLLNLCYVVKGIEFYSKLNINLIGYAVVLTDGLTSLAIYYIAKELLLKLFL